MEADVTVVGSGGAGLIAAMTAADAGAQTIIIEKMGNVGGVWALYGGTVAGAGTNSQKRIGIQHDNPETFLSDIMKLNLNPEWISHEVLRYYCQNAADAVNWLDELLVFAPPNDKVSFGFYKDPWTFPRALSSPNPLVKTIRPMLDRYIADNRIRVFTHHHAQSLIERDGQVVGLRVKNRENKFIDVLSGAVILATGGFGFNREMLKHNLPAATQLVSHAPSFARGDGHRMCQEIGSAMVNMNHMVTSGPYMGAVPGLANSMRSIAQINPWDCSGVIWVDAFGKRVVNEDGNMFRPEVRKAVSKAPGHIINMILDSQRLLNDKLLFPKFFTCPERDWAWFHQKVNEGVIARADTVFTLGEYLGIRGNDLVDTVNRWNRFVENGNDADFSRRDLTKIEIPPFYGIRTVTSVIASSGGPAVNQRQQVINTTGTVIQGLYAAGELAGYRGIGTGNLTTGNIVFGRCAGSHAAREALKYKRGI